MLASEFAAIQEFVQDHYDESLRRVLNEDKNVFVPGTDYGYTACQFRDVEHGRCAIYPVRPTICRLFGHVEWLPCPIEKVAAPAPGGIDFIGRYSDGTLRTFDEWAGEPTTKNLA